MAQKPVFKPRDRFSYKDGFGYVLNENQAILFSPKKGRSPKYSYVDDIPSNTRCINCCPESIVLAMDALDLIKDLTVREEELVETKELVEA